MRDGYAILKHYLPKGLPLPEWYLDEPPPVSCGQFFLEAFWELSSCRAFGMVMGPIPWLAIHAWGTWRKLDDVSLRIFVRVMREMDEAYIDWCMKQNPKPKPDSVTDNKGQDLKGIGRD